MDITKAEHLPNELWLQIFSYLENVEILYVFNMLNKRFQNLLLPYLNDIDLSEVSLKQFNTLMKDILSSKQDHQIDSLTLKNSGQFQKIFYPQNRYDCESRKVVLSKNILDIQTLKLTIDHWCHGSDLLRHTLPQLSSMSNLTDLHLNILSVTYMEDTFRRIFEHLPSTLTKLTILGFWKQSRKGYRDLNWFQLPSNIKSFAFSIKDLETIYETYFSQTANNHIEELKISFHEFNRFNDKYSSLKFSTSLITLHLELPLLNLETLQDFLKLFTNQLKSLILIIRTSIKMASILQNQLNTMIIDIFPLLETFKYTIHFSNKTITNSYPAALSFTDILTPYVDEVNNNYYHRSKDTRSLSVLNFQVGRDLSNINFSKLIKLIYQLSDNLNQNEIDLLNNFLRISPNLNCLELSASNSQTFIELLKLIPTKNITKLYCNIPEFHHSFLIELSQIIPHIRELTLKYIHFNEYFMKDRRTYKDALIGKMAIYTEALTAKMAIEHVQLYYKELIHLYLYMQSFSDTDDEIFRAHKHLQKWLQDKEQQTRFYSIYRPNNEYDENISMKDEDEFFSHERTHPFCLYVSP